MCVFECVFRFVLFERKTVKSSVICMFEISTTLFVVLTRKPNGLDWERGRVFVRSYNACFMAIIIITSKMWFVPRTASLPTANTNTVRHYSKHISIPYTIHLFRCFNWMHRSVGRLLSRLSFTKHLNS